MDTSDTPMRYPGPLDLAHAHTKLNHVVSRRKAAFTRDGPRADNEYRDLGLSPPRAGALARNTSAPSAVRAADRLALARHDRALVIVLKGWIKFRFAGVEGDVTVKPEARCRRPAGVAHNVIARSDDLELIEINMPAEYGTKDLGARSTRRSRERRRDRQTRAQRAAQALARG